ncbi:MAG: AAA family ATPase [Phycisphaerales bacterium]|nr:AAA family ATPase [Phycisphaerales bacterium]
MLTRLRIRNFKRFDDVDVELGKAVVFIGPNNSGKTTALQAIALWDIGVRRWNEKRKGRDSPEKRPGVTINRHDLISIPVPDSNLLWRNLHVRKVESNGIVEKDGHTRSKTRTENVRIDVIVDGLSHGKAWSCGIEFDYANAESFYCRPLRTTEEGRAARMPVPDDAGGMRVAFLPPMSGLAAVEPKWEVGRINVLLGEGQTAQVLRNLCYQIHVQNGTHGHWTAITREISRLFGATLDAPQYVAERGEITMAYREQNGSALDLSSSGRGLQQTLLLLAHLYANPGSVLLLDEPDAHLEILRQRQIYQLLTETAERQGSQIIAASHSEVVLNEAAKRDVVVAFVGSPHRVNDRGSQALKALRDIGFDQYLQAEQTGWVLYLEGATDLSILQSFARTLKHEAARDLERPFVCYVGNQPDGVRRHLFGLREAKPDLVGVALFDRLERPLPDDLGAEGLEWTRREIENYLGLPDVLEAYARHDLQYQDDLFDQAEAESRVALMKEIISDLVPPIALRDGPGHHWWRDTKITDDFLDPLFTMYFEKLGLPNLMRKSDYHQLAALVPREALDLEVSEVLDRIAKVARKARPAG